MLLPPVDAQQVREPDRLEDREAIQWLVGVFSVGLMAGSRKPGLFLSPHIQGADREKAVSFAERKYKILQIGFIAEYEIQFTDATHAFVEADVRWASDQFEVERRALVRFEKVNGDWYFENFEFLQPPQARTSVIVVVALLMAVIVGFGLGLRQLKRRRSV